MESIILSLKSEINWIPQEKSGNLFRLEKSGKVCFNVLLVYLLY